ncbi:MULTISPECIES: hypothetical protein [Paenibacillus]|uniref:hypothetical protein n=1 Tax=Paenibacillus TaxID=44249 RepID=UPI0020405943|nr:MULTISPECIES: hypothetical protein [Paenibacillus]
MLRVKNEIKAKKLINQIESIIGQKVMNVSVERYWKDDELMEANFVTHFTDDMTEAEATVVSLQLVHNLGYRWSVGYPGYVNVSGHDQPVWNFEGICNKTRITGVEWVLINLFTRTDDV